MTISISSNFHDYSLTANTFSQEDIEKIRLAFDKYDLNQNGTVNLMKLIFVFNLLGQSITESEILELLDSSSHGMEAHEKEPMTLSARNSESIQSSPRDIQHSTRTYNQESYNNHTANASVSQGTEQNKDYSKIEVPFHIFLSMLSAHRESQEKTNSEQDYLDAFVSIGGDASGLGYLKIKKLRELCDEFELNIDVHEFLKNFEGENGKIRFESFKRGLIQGVK